jgi:sigma-E factor negative regulatory protein RseA
MVMDRISAFMDGETRRHEARQAILRLKQDQEYCESWNTFHLIGDVMRGSPLLQDDFTARLRSRLQQEPTVLAPRFSWRKPGRLALSAAASLAAVAVILTMVTIDNPLKPQPPIAVAPQPAVPSPQVAQAGGARPHPVSAADQAKVNEYLMVHQEFSPSTALQGFAPYVRTVSVAHGVDGR